MLFIKTLLSTIAILIVLPLHNAWSSPEIPMLGTVTMADLGSTSCVPCKLMEPILEKLQSEYQGKAAIIFVDVAKDRELARKFGIRAIPTQIFFDKNGNEVWRHAGFLEKIIITEQIDSLLNRGSSHAK